MNDMNHIFGTDECDYASDYDQVQGCPEYDKFETQVYARFPEYMHGHVEEALFYRGAELQSGEVSMREFAEQVSECAVSSLEVQKQELEAEIMFEGVRQLILEGKIEKPQFVEELTDELRKGPESTLARFIFFQKLRSPMDAAITFLAWKHTKALVELEEAFGVCLDNFRDAKEAEFFCTSESNIALINFSVMSQ